MRISCDDATTICDKGQYGKVKFFEKLKLRLHLLVCKKCGLYTKQNSVMSKCYKKQQEFEKRKQCCLTEEEKKQMENNLKETL